MSFKPFKVFSFALFKIYYKKLMLSIWNGGITSEKNFLVNNHNTYGNCRKDAEKKIEQQPARKTNSRNRHRWHNKAKQPTHTGPTSKRGKTFAEPPGRLTGRTF
jgi:hypothetical protein